MGEAHLNTTTAPTNVTKQAALSWAHSFKTAKRKGKNSGDFQNSQVIVKPGKAKREK